MLYYAALFPGTRNQCILKCHTSSISATRITWKVLLTMHRLLRGSARGKPTAKAVSQVPNEIRWPKLFILLQRSEHVSWCAFILVQNWLFLVISQFLQGHKLFVHAKSTQACEQKKENISTFFFLSRFPGKNVMNNKLESILLYWHYSINVLYRFPRCFAIKTHAVHARGLASCELTTN